MLKNSKIQTQIWVQEEIKKIGVYIFVINISLFLLQFILQKQLISVVQKMIALKLIQFYFKQYIIISSLFRKYKKLIALKTTKYSNPL